MNNKLLLVLIFSLLNLIFYSSPSEAWIIGYNDRTLIQTNSTLNMSTDFSLPITFTFVSGDVASNCSDINITTSADVPLSFYTWSCSSSSALLYISNNYTTNNETMYAYYNKTGATTASNGSLTFKFFDDLTKNKSNSYNKNGSTWTYSAGNSYKINESKACTSSTCFMPILDSGNLTQNYTIYAEMSGDITTNTAFGFIHNAQNGASTTSTYFDRASLGTDNKLQIYTWNPVALVKENTSTFMNSGNKYFMNLTVKTDGSFDLWIWNATLIRNVTGINATWKTGWVGISTYLNNNNSVAMYLYKAIIMKQSNILSTYSIGSKEVNAGLPWANTSLLYRVLVQINNTINSNTLTNYQVPIIFDTKTPISSGKMRSDGGDIIFFADDNTTSLTSYVWNSSHNEVRYTNFPVNQKNTMMTVIVPSIAGNSMTNIWLYYGNASTTRNNLINSVFTDVETTTQSHMPAKRYNLGCTAMNDSVYFIGGDDPDLSQRTQTIYKYNVTSNATTTMSGTLPTKTDVFFCSSVNGNIYCLGGYDGTNYLNQVLLYNVSTDSVSQINTLPFPKAKMGCGVYKDSIVCGGGQNSTSYTNTIIQYNITSNTTTVLSATLPTSWGSHSGQGAAIVKDSIYFFDDYSGTANINATYKYNITSNTITNMSVLPRVVRGHSCIAYGDDESIFCFGGYNGSYIQNIFRFNVTSNSTTQMNDMSKINEDECCASIGTEIVCGGGNDGSTFYDNIFRYGRKYSEPIQTVFVGIETSQSGNSNTLTIVSSTSALIIFNSNYNATNTNATISVSGNYINRNWYYTSNISKTPIAIIKSKVKYNGTHTLLNLTNVNIYIGNNRLTSTPSTSVGMMSFVDENKAPIAATGGIMVVLYAIRDKIKKWIDDITNKYINK